MAHGILAQTQKKNLKVKQLVLIGKKIFNSKSKIILKKKQYYESRKHDFPI